ncbi:uncharacterized protein PADG_02765 [Paracoccidioides brasiliensis Pb18]|uniref:Uncharacterized protein n=1 Tax=Paracoccidioides brasiliensis (strain Pb18) TaxID=502780 RepID=C1G6G0_PARBD|nr:uncharacterized protein PADG_02765 [Paracoccidioides brasiliensis Pb18]EEH46667.2 hypothetical protein PADG_02765 [Paracoccidioides brasiliensis Pb18]
MLQNFRRVAPACHLRVPQTTRRSFTSYNGIVQVQRVRIKRRWLKRGVVTILSVNIASQLYGLIIGSSLDRLVENDESIAEDLSLEQQVDTQEHGNLQKQDIPFFPVGLPYTVPGELYSEDDPEWKTFEKFANDNAQFVKLRNDLLDRATEIVNEKAVKAVTDVTGAPLKPTRRTSIKFNFPTHKPLGYVQPGFELRGDDISWTTRPIPGNRGEWIRSIFEPWSLMTSSWVAGQYLFTAKIAKLRKMLGIPKTESSNRRTTDDQSHIASPKDTDSASASNFTRSITYPLTSNAGAADLTQSGGSTEFQSSKASSALQNQAGVPREPISDVRIAINIFKLFLLLSRRKKQNETPQQGSFRMNGIALFSGPKGGCEVHIIGTYEPAKKSWYDVNVLVLNTFPYRSKYLNSVHKPHSQESELDDYADKSS